MRAKTRRRKYASPNRIISLFELQNLLQDNIAPCPACDSNSRQIIIKHRSSLASSVILKCSECELTIRKYRNKVHYLEKQLISLKGSEERKIEYRKCNMLSILHVAH